MTTTRATLTNTTSIPTRRDEKMEPDKANLRGILKYALEFMFANIDESMLSDLEQFGVVDEATLKEAVDSILKE
jgi:hypothetical protein